MTNCITLKNYSLNHKPKHKINPKDSSNTIYKKLNLYFSEIHKIYSTIDTDIIASYNKDWSNIPGASELLARPIDKYECAATLKTCFDNKILVTISAGKTNLTGSATPKGGIILSTDNLLNPKIILNKDLKEVSSSVGIPLEQLRKEVLTLSNNTLYYPVDPTSRNDALVGGTLSCNASGFIPGEKGATRYWVNEVEFILPNGYGFTAKRREYISKNGVFIFQRKDVKIILPIPKYKRPNIKNASGPFSNHRGQIDLIDLIIGSEGIFGIIVACKLKVATRPKSYLELFLCLDNEDDAISFHDYLYKKFEGDMSKISALEYFGYNSQTYMKNRNFFFKNDDDVGIYIQIPIHKGNIESKSMEWIELINTFDDSIDLDSIIVLNDPLNWKKFFEARHSIPDNALTKTRQLGGISIITDTIVPPNNYRKYLKLIHNKLQNENIEYLLFGHLGDCHLHFHLIPNENQDKKCLEIYDYMVDLSAELGGVYSAEHGTGKRKRNDFIKCYGYDAAKMVKQSKLSVDPDLILNRGNIFI